MDRVDPILVLGCLVLALPIAAVAIVVAIIRARRRRRVEGAAWQTLAQRLNIRTSDPNRPVSMSGVYRDREIMIFIREYPPPSAMDVLSLFFGHTRGTVVLLTARNPVEGVRLSLTSENLQSRVDKLAGIRELEIGDPGFDKRFYIISKPETLGQRVFSSPFLRKRILRQRNPGFEFDGEDIQWMCAGIETDVDYMQSVTDYLYDLLDVIEEQGTHVLRPR
jgi:hypothetical protein